MLTRDQILHADDLAMIRVEVPEWGGSVNLRALTGAQRDKFEQRCTAAKIGNQTSVVGLMAMLVAMSLANGLGEPLFDERDLAKNIEALNGKSAKALGRLFDAALKLNGLTQEELDAIAGNSSAGPSADSG